MQLTSIFTSLLDVLLSSYQMLLSVLFCRNTVSGQALSFLASSTYKNPC